MVIRIQAPLWNNRLRISDPKAIQYILRTTRYNFVKPYAARFTLNAATAPGVNGAEVQEFRSRVDSESHNGGRREENTPEFFCRAILNALGRVTFDYDFRDDCDDKAELSASLRDFMCTPIRPLSGFGLPSNWNVSFEGVMDHVPPSLLGAMIYLPTSGLAFLRRHVQLSNDIVQNLILSRSPEMDDDKDTLSQIGIMNSLTRISTLLGAGYETAGTSLGWILFELETYPGEQHQLREEVNKEIWGEDADVWRPIRWDGQDPRTQRGSVGEFALTQKATWIRKDPMVESEERKGNQLPLKDSLISLDEQGDEGEFQMEIPPRHGAVIFLSHKERQLYKRLWEAVGWF
ncbi:hypothetical protein EDB89DRAFT_1902241 [Lactarius sanguifluus]|nr:hypothetical protein EDB89DRAFT_1902241 [Lactarius sanguifluus]